MGVLLLLPGGGRTDREYGLVRSLGSAKSEAAGTTLTITLADDVPEGDTIVVRAAHAYTSGAPTVTIHSTVYTNTRTSASGTTARFSTFVIQSPAGGLAVGDTIVLTTGSVAGRVAVADQYTGLSGVVANQSGYATTGGGIGVDRSTTFATTTDAVGLVECVYSIEPVTNDHVMPADFDEAARDGTTTAATNVTAAACWRPVLTTGTYEITTQLENGVVFQFHMLALTIASPPAAVTPEPPDGSPYVAEVASAAATTSGRYMQLTLPRDVAAGATLVCRFGHEYTAAAALASDLRGNTYVAERTAGSASATAGPPIAGVRATVFRCFVVAPLSAGDKITFKTAVAVGPKVAVADEFTGLQNTLSGTPNGYTGTGLGLAGAGTATGTYMDTADDNVVQINMVASIEPDASPVEVSPAYTAFTPAGTEAATNNVTVGGGWKSALAAGRYTYQFKLTEDVPYVLLLFAVSVQGGLPVEARNYDEVVAALGAVSFYRCDEGAGDLADSIRGVGHDAAVHGGVTRISGGVAFDGETGYLEIPDDAAFSIGETGMSVVVWMRPDTLDNTAVEGADPPTGEGRYVHWIGKGNADDGYEWVGRMYNQHQADGTLLPAVADGGRRNRCSFYAFNIEGALGSGSYTPQVSDSWQPAAGEWVFFCATYNQVGPSIFRDGLRRDADFYSDFEVTPEPTSAPVRVGTRDFDSFFTGAVAGIAVFDRPLTDEEVYRLHQVAQTPPPTPGQAPYVDLVPSYDLDQVFNKWTGTREGGDPQIWEDTASQHDYALRSKQVASLVTTDTEVLNQMQWKTSQFAQPLNRVESITVMPLADPDDADRAAASLARDIGDRITVLETPPGITTQRQGDYIIQHLSGQISPGPATSMRLTFLLWPASVSAFWIAGDPELGLVGVSTRPGY